MAEGCANCQEVRELHGEKGGGGQDPRMQYYAQRGVRVCLHHDEIFKCDEISRRSPTREKDPSRRYVGGAGAELSWCSKAPQRGLISDNALSFWVSVSIHRLINTK